VIVVVVANGPKDKSCILLQVTMQNLLTMERATRATRATTTNSTSFCSGDLGYQPTLKPAPKVAIGFVGKFSVGQ
jgi:hypothetical protein